MKLIAFCADIHFGAHRQFGNYNKHVSHSTGANDRSQLILETIQEAINTCARAGAEQLVVCGDVFDIATPGPTLTAQLIKLVFAGAQYRSHNGFRYIQVNLMGGNHDHVSDTANALDPLIAATWFDENKRANVHGHVLPKRDGNLLMVPYLTGNTMAQLGPILADTTASIVAIHAGLSDENDPPWFRAAHDAVDISTLALLLHDTSVKTVVAGNWHNPKRWDVGGIKFIQCGTLCPTGFEDTDNGLLHIISDDGKYKTAYEIPGPRFRTFRERDGDTVTTLVDWLTATTTNTRFGRFIALPEHVEKVKAELQLENLLNYTSVEADKAEIEERMAVNRTAIRAQATVEQAIHTYVRKLALAPGVHPDDVLALALELYKGELDVKYQ